MTPVANGALPTFLVIGAQKCGTTSLHQYLDAHPDVQGSRPKELKFFSGDPDPDAAGLTDPEDRAQVLSEVGTWQLGMSWYRSHFDPRFPARGESSPQYSTPMHPHAPERIARAVPDARLIFCVRDPVERAISAYRFASALDVDPRSIDEALRPEGAYARGSRYWAMLAPYISLFPRERILVVEADKLAAERQAMMRSIFSFIGVADDFWSDALERRWNVTATQRGARWWTITRLRRQVWWAAIGSRVPQRGVWLLERLRTSRSTPRPPVDPSAEARATLAASLSEDAARFRTMTGLELANWSV